MVQPDRDKPSLDAAEAAAAMVGMYEGPMKAEWLNQPTTLRSHELSQIEAFLTDKSVRILNLGCGSGRETFALYDLGYRDVVGVDPAVDLLRAAESRAIAGGIEVEFRHGSAAHIPFEDASFDVVTLFTNTYAHISPRSARVAALKEVNRVLQPGGHLFLEAHSLLNRRSHQMYIWLLDVGRRVYNPHEMEPGDKTMKGARAIGSVRLARSHWFLPTEVESEIAEADFEVVRATTQVQVALDSGADSRVYRNAGRLEYVALKPQGR